MNSTHDWIVRVSFISCNSDTSFWLRSRTKLPGTFNCDLTCERLDRQREIRLRTKVGVTREYSQFELLLVRKISESLNETKKGAALEVAVPLRGADSLLEATERR